MSELVDVGPLDRGTYLGGVDMSALLGINPWRTPMDVWLAKTGQAVPPKPDPAREKRLLRGKRMEPYIVDMLVEDYGIAIDARNHRYVDQEYPFMAAEIDFEWHDAADARIRNGEIKTTAIMPGQMNPWGAEGTDEIPVYHAAQSMYGLMITGREVCQYGTLFGMDTLALYALQRDEDTIAQLRETARAFWLTNVIPRVPPPPTTLGDLAKLWPVDRRGKIEATPEIETALHSHRELGLALREIEKGRDAVEFKIKEFCGDHAEIITRNGTTIATYKSQSRSSLDTKALKVAKPDVYNEFLQSTTFRVLRHSTTKAKESV